MNGNKIEARIIKYDFGEIAGRGDSIDGKIHQGGIIEQVIFNARAKTKKSKAWKKFINNMNA